MAHHSGTRIRRIALLVLATGLGLIAAAPAPPPKHGAETIDDTGSIFDESGDSSPAPPAKAPPSKAPPVKPPPKDPAPNTPVAPPKVPLEKPPVQTPVKTPQVTSTPAKTSAATKLPVPDVKARTASLKLVREVYAADYVKTTPNEVRALAQRLFDQSRQTADDPAARYVLLSEATDRAAAGGDAALAMRAVRVLVRGYRVDGPAAALAALTTASRAKGATAEALIACARAALDFSR